MEWLALLETGPLLACCAVPARIVPDVVDITLIPRLTHAGSQMNLAS